MRVVKVAVAVACLSVTAMGGARAQMLVFDPQAVAQQVQQLQQQVQQLSTLKQQLEQGQQLYSSLNRLTDINAVASLLSRPEIRSALPTDYKQIQSLFSGSGAGSFGTAASSFLSGNSHYTSPGNDFYSQEIARLAKRHGRRPEPCPVDL